MITIQLTYNGVETLTRVRDFIQRHANRFNWSLFFMRTNNVELEDVIFSSIIEENDDHWCGTHCCIAGFIIAFTSPPESRLVDRIYRPDEYGDTEINAAKSIGVPMEHWTLISRFLFMPWGWVDKNGDTLSAVAREHNVSPDRGLYAVKEAISRINWVLEEKKLNEYVITRPSWVQ